MSGESASAVTRVRPASLARRFSTFLYEHSKVRLALLLAAPLTWLVLVYIAALVALLITALWSVDAFTGEIKTDWTLKNITQFLTGALYQTVTI